MQMEEPSTLAELAQSLERSGYGRLDASVTPALVGLDAAGWADLRRFWSNLPRDAFLKDGGRYRTRRHGSFVYERDGQRLEPVPHRAHWQPVEYNALHGGMHRRFEPLEDAFVAIRGVQRCIAVLAEVAAARASRARMFVEVHQVRIDTASGIGRPTPEGAHRDGVDLVAVWLAGRDDVRGGETRVFEADGPSGVRFTMREPGTALVLDDRRVLHETTPILPGARDGSRDTLVVTYRADGFLEP